MQARDGSEAYTRRGDLKIDPNGLLVTGNDLPVMGDGGPIALPPFDVIQIGTDGTISIRPQGAAASELAVLDRIKLVDPQFDLMRMKDGSEAPASVSQRLTSGALEQSNVNIVNEMVNMIELSRRYEMQVKLMKTAEETAASSASIVRPV